MSRLRRIATDDTTAGVLLLAAALVAVVWANSPAQDLYHELTGIRVGPAAWHLDLTVATWAADGLLAVFFLVVGLELKHELVAGSLSNRREAGVPVLAAVGGMVVPAATYTAVVASMGTRAELHGWAIPAATDIAFAVTVLMIAGRGLPLALRTFLLTLAVMDDLLAIIVIAVFYTAQIDLVSLGAAAASVALFAIVVRRDRAPVVLLVPLGLVAWAFMHSSGVHATVAGVLLGMTVPVARDGSQSRAEHWAGRIGPWSSGLALPVFAFCAAGVTIPVEAVGDVLTSPVALGTALGLVVGKVVGVLGTTALVTSLTPLRLPQGIGVRDLLGVGFLTGIGFTVALLIAELSFPDGTEREAAKAAILLGSIVAAAAGAIALRLDARRARSTDMNRDGIPDGPLPRIGD